jgi:hypothetical protein
MNSFLNGKKNLAIAPLHRPGGAVAMRPPACAASPAAASAAGGTHVNVEVIKEGDKVVRLVVICVCGERVEIECLYPAGS